jgi:hypothetical protein
LRSFIPLYFFFKKTALAPLSRRETLDIATMPGPLYASRQSSLAPTPALFTSTGSLTYTPMAPPAVDAREDSPQSQEALLGPAGDRESSSRPGNT